MVADIALDIHGYAEQHAYVEAAGFRVACQADAVRIMVKEAFGSMAVTLDTYTERCAAEKAFKEVLMKKFPDNKKEVDDYVTKLTTLSMEAAYDKMAKTLTKNTVKGK